MPAKLVLVTIVDTVKLPQQRVEDILSRTVARIKL